MSTKSSITIHLTNEQREALERQAKRRGVPAAKLALDLILTALLGMEENADKRRQQGLEALERLSELTAGLPPIDAVQIAHQAREELEERTDRWLWS